jgi:hypothetical protein
MKNLAAFIVALLTSAAIAGPFAVSGGGAGGGSGTVTAVSVTTANGVSGSVANSTTTPAISLTLGAITPSAVTTGTVTATVLAGTPTYTLTNATGLPLSTGVTGTLAAAQFPALTGDVTTSAGTTTTVLSSVVTAGTCTSCNLTIDAKGRVTAQASGTGGGATLGANTFTRLQTITQGAASEGILASTGGSNTGSNASSALDFSWLLNTSGSPDVFALRITDTARGASTKFLNIYGGASGTTSTFSITRLGEVIAGGGAGSASGSATSPAFQMANNNSGLWSPSAAQLGVSLNGGAYWNFATGVLSGRTGGMFGWSNSSTDPLNGGNYDTAIARTAAKVVEVNSGTAGTYTGTALVLGPQTVAQLPTCSSTTKGARATATDATSTTFLATLTGSGANIVPAFCNGTNWLIGEAANDRFFNLMAIG